MTGDGRITEVDAEVVHPNGSERLVHLAAHRGLIVRRALLASAIRGFLPLPMVDEILAQRVRAGLFQKLAASRQVDLPPASAAILAGRQDKSETAQVTLVAAAAVVAKLARFTGRKFLALLAAGRGAEEMARTFVKATLLDHYCAKLHVGGPIAPEQATRLSALIGAADSRALLDPVLAAFREGGHVLGRSLSEVPRWLSRNLASLGERFTRSGGNPDVLDATPVQSEGDPAWLDRAAQAVEAALAREGNAYLARVVRDFEESWRREQDQADAD